MKNLIMYHDHCTDGFGAAYVAWTRFEDAAEYLPMSYGQVKTISDLANLPKQPIDSYQEIYVMDFSLPKDVMEWLFKAGKRVIWLDHHKTAFEMYELPIGQFEDVTGDRHVELNNNKSGAMLAWEHFYPADDCPKMIKHIDDRDRWQFKIPGTKEFHAFMESNKPWTFQQWNDIFGEMERGFDDDIYREGAAILRAHQQDVKTIFDVGVRNCAIIIPTDNEDRCIGLSANCPPHFASDVGHELANKSLTYGLCWYIGRDGKVKCSLRSNGDYDVSAIAKSFGGGGHMNAAGFETSIETLLGWLK